MMKKEDLFASIVVFLISMPICLGVAIASGLNPVAGIFTGIIGGVIVGIFSGAPLQISGPSTGLAVMVLHVVDVYGPTALIPLGIIVGVAQLATGFFKVAHFFQATPPALLKGMLSGIGAAILLSQIYILFDLKMSSEGLKNIAGLPAIFGNLFTGNMNELQTHSLILGAIVIVILALWSKGKHQIFELLPGPLVATVVASVLVLALGWEVKMVNLPENIFSKAFDYDYLGIFAALDMNFVLYSLGFAFVASAETLLCVSAVDKMARTDSNYNKQIMAQGTGNLVAGALGAIPVVGVISRSAANVEFGAKTKLAGILSGIWIGLFLFLPDVLAYIPIPALAGLLIYIGYKLLDIFHIWDYIRNRNKTSLIFFTTLCLTITVDLLVGVVGGFAVSILILVWDVLKFDLSVEQRGDNKVLKFNGKLSFLDLPVLSKKLKTQGLEDVSNLEICLREVEYLDPAILEHLDELKDKLESQGKKIEIHYNKFTMH
ncbi:MAG: hypothetical protein CMJ16_04620 [Peredibacter sp.]|nr:hypothetical protein [Peredibacter sp.]